MQYNLPCSSCSTHLVSHGTRIVNAWAESRADLRRPSPHSEPRRCALSHARDVELVATHTRSVPVTTYWMRSHTGSGPDSLCSRAPHHNSPRPAQPRNRIGASYGVGRIGSPVSPYQFSVRRNGSGYSVSKSRDHVGGCAALHPLPQTPILWRDAASHHPASMGPHANQHDYSYARLPLNGRCVGPHPTVWCRLHHCALPARVNLAGQQSDWSSAQDRESEYSKCRTVSFGGEQKGNQEVCCGNE